MSKRTLTGEQAKCYVCQHIDKKGNLQRCLGWHLVKRLEDDAREYNQLQEAAQAQDDELELQRKALQQSAANEHGATHQEADVHVDVLELSGSGTFPAHADHLHPVFDGQDQQAGVGVPRAADPALTLREVPRFQLFSRNTTIFDFAACPFAPTDIMHNAPPVMLVEGPQLSDGGVRYFHQTCLHRGEHLRHYRRVLHWSGSSNINPKKKNAGRRDMVKVTGRTALCNDCLGAFAIATNSDPHEMLPKETDPERRQRKVSSRRRLTNHAREQPALEEAHSMVFSLCVTAGNHFELKETSSFAALRAAAPDVNSACEALEVAIRNHLTPAGPALENSHNLPPKRQREEYEAGGVGPADVGTSASLDISLNMGNLDCPADNKHLHSAANSFGQHDIMQSHVSTQSVSHLSDTAPNASHLPEAVPNVLAPTFNQQAEYVMGQQ